MPRLRSKLLLIFGAVLVVPVLVLIAELVTRVFYPRIDPLEVFVASPQLRADTQGETTSGLFEFDPLLTWRLRAGLKNVWWDYTAVTTNQSHIRMDREIGVKPSLRIVCLGDSVTFGYRVPVAADQKSPASFDAGETPFPALLERQLRTSRPDAEVLPLACPGYTSWQGLAWLRRDLEKLRPDIVIACFGWNDVRAAGLPDSVTMPQGAQATVRGMIAHSQLMLRMARSAMQRKAPPLDAPPEPRITESEYVENFRQMAAVCEHAKARLVVVLPFYRDPNLPGDYPEQKAHAGDPAEGARMTAYRKALKDAMETSKLATLEIPELTEKSWPANAQYFGERIHPNSAGHRLIAERLGDFLRPLLR